MSKGLFLNSSITHGMRNVRLSGGKMLMNLDLRFEIYKKFGSQFNAARVLNMREDRLSKIIRGRILPKSEEKRHFARKLGRKITGLFPE